MPRRRAFCIMSLRVPVFGEAKALRAGAEAKASQNMAFSQLPETRNRVIYPCAG